MSVTTSDVRDFVDQNKAAILDLVKRMVAIDSVTGNETQMARFCAGWLEGHGIEAILQPCKDRFNTIGVVGNGGMGSETLVISGHLDTVPFNRGAWTFGPHDPTVKDGKLYGLGSSDLKASIASAYFASLFLKQHDLPGRFVTAFTIEEETTGDGTELFLQWAEREKFLDFKQTAAVVTEPTGLDHLSLGNRGSTFVQVTVTGKGGHGSRPHQAKNPLDKAREILSDLPALVAQWNEQHPDPAFGGTTVTPTSLNAGDLERTNVIPEVATMLLDCRPTAGLFANDFAAFRKDLGAFFARHTGNGFTVEWKELYPRPGHKLDREHRLAQTTLKVLQNDLGIKNAEFRYTPAGNDAVYFGVRGIPCVNKVGPGHPECAHRVDEYVTVENIYKGVELFIWLGLRWFGRV